MLRYGEKDIKKCQRLWQTIRSGETWEGEFNNRTRSGEPCWEQARISPIRNTQGEVNWSVDMYSAWKPWCVGITPNGA